MRMHRSERGAAMVELAIFLPLLVMLLAAATTVTSVLSGYAELQDVSQSAARYATRAQIDPARGDGARYRPTAAEVEAYVRSISGVTIDSVTVTPDPSSAHPGTPIEIAIRARISTGPLGGAANAVGGAFAGIFGGSPPFPNGDVAVTSTTVMREE